jgi:phosphate transport system permease protein
MTITFDSYGRRRIVNLVMTLAAFAAVGLALLPLVSILYTATVRGLPALGPGFLTDQTPLPCSGSACPHGGIGPAIEGTLILISLASLISVPIGLMTGIFLSEYGSNTAGRTVRFLTDVMTGVPSIVVGIFTYTLFLYAANAGYIQFDYIHSAISGAFAISVIMIPIVARTTDEALRLVPTSTREAGLALGLPQWVVVSRIVLSSGRTAVVTGVLLGLSRAAGETAPLLVTALGSLFLFRQVNAPIGALPLTIYQLGLSPYSNWIDDAWGAALVLVVMMLLINIGARVALKYGGPRGSTR